MFALGAAYFVIGTGAFIGFQADLVARAFTGRGRNKPRPLFLFNGVAFGNIQCCEFGAGSVGFRSLCVTPSLDITSGIWHNTVSAKDVPQSRFWFEITPLIVASNLTAFTFISYHLLYFNRVQITS